MLPAEQRRETDDNIAARGRAMSGLLIPAGQRYSCVGCGGCCRRWQVAVTPEVAERLQEYPWAEKFPELAGRELFQKGGKLLHFAQTADGDCAFLAPDQRCYIHAELGLAAKSMTCRLFPLSFLHTPDGPLLYLSFACPEVAASRGDLLTEKAEELARDAAEAEPFTVKLSGSVPVAAGLTAPWPDYAKLEAALLRLYARTAFTRRVRLVALALMTDAFVAAVVRGDQAELLGRIAADAELDRCAGLAATLAARPRRQQNLILGAFIGTGETPGHDARRSIGISVRVVFGRGRIALARSLRTTLDLTAAEKVATPDFVDGECEPLDRFVRHLIVRKALIHPLPLYDGSRFMLVALGLVRWYARAHATQAGRTTATRDDYCAAIALVERLYIAHSMFFNKLHHTAATAFFMKRMFAAVDFPATVLGD